MRAGGTIEEALPMYQEELIPLAAEQGYEVITEGITYPELE